MSNLLKNLSIYLAAFITGFLFLQPAINPAHAQQVKKPFSIDLGLGSGMIGNDEIPSALLPELEFSFIPGRYGLGLNTGFYSHESSFNPDNYRSGFENFTSVNGSDPQWKSFFVGLGPRIEFGANLPVQFKAGMDLSFTRNSPPQSEVLFSDETGAFHDVNLTLSEFSAGDDFKKWSTAIKPEFQVQFSPGRSQRFGFHITTGIQHQLSENSFTYSERDLSRVQNVDNAREMFFQFETAPVVERTEQAPKTNFFVNAGIKISFGGSRAPAAPTRDYNSSRSNKPSGSISNDGGGDCDDDDPRCTPGSSRAQDYNSSRSNKPSSEAALGDVVLVKGEGLTMVDSFIDEIIEVLDRCEDEVCKQVRQNADGRKDVYRQVNQSRISQDQGIEAIHSIVMEDVVSLQKCETDVCKEVLTKEVQLLEHMNVLMSLVQSGRAAGEWDELIDESVELAQDYNSSRSNKPSTRSDEIGDGEGDGSGQQVVLITQDDDGKVYAWGGAPEAIMQDENGKLYAWGSGHQARLQGEDGKVYSWGVASSASLQSGDGEVSCVTPHSRNPSWPTAPTHSWDGNYTQEISDDNEGQVYCWGNNYRASVDSCEGDSCPQPGSDALYMAKELGLASVGDDIEQIKQVLDRCDEGVCGQVRLNADHRDNAVRRAQDNPADMDTHIDEIRNIVKEDVESLGRCETDVCREALAMEEKLLVKMNRLSDMEQVAPAQDYNTAFGNGKDGKAGGGDGPTKEAPPTYDVMHNGELFKICNTGADLDAISASDPDYDSWLADCIDYGTGDDGGFPALDAAHSLFTSGVNWPDGFNPAGTIISAGSVMISPHPDSPIYEGDAIGGENVLNKGEMNTSSEDDFNAAGMNSPIYEMANAGGNGDGDNSNGEAIPVQRFQLQPSSYCLDLSSDFQQGIRTDAQNHNSSRSNETEGVAKPDLDSDGFPEIMKGASFSISKRSARTGRSQNPLYEGETNRQTNPMYETEGAKSSGGGDSDGDGYGDVDGFHFELELNDPDPEAEERASGNNTNAPPGQQLAPSQTKVIVMGATDNGDGLPSEEANQNDAGLQADSDSDGDGQGDALESATYSISKRSARTGRSESQDNSRLADDTENAMGTGGVDGNVYKWNYNMRELQSDTNMLSGNGTLTILYTGGKWHFNVQIDPDDDGDGLGDFLQKISFSISKRSARTGRNPETGKEIK